jgi:hypothetical protein
VTLDTVLGCIRYLAMCSVSRDLCGYARWLRNGWRESRPYKVSGGCRLFSTLQDLRLRGLSILQRNQAYRF